MFGVRQRLRELRHSTVSQGSLAMYRIMFGALMLWAVIRQFYFGWIDYNYLTPKFFFTYPGFEWVTPLAPWAMYGLFTLMAGAACFIMMGRATRLASTIFFLGFTYVELIDKTTYLNHYYLVSILSFFLIWAPLTQTNPWGSEQKISQAWLLIFRLQVGIVYFYAGVAKLNYDWLVLAQPLGIWFQSNTDIPLIGFFLSFKESAILGSWVGAIFDLSVPFLLTNSKTRPWTFGAVVIFHIFTAALFNLGLFPWLMIANACLFFSANWPRKIPMLGPWLSGSKPPYPPKTDYPKMGIFAIVFFTCHFMVQILLPLRSHLYEGYSLWTENGFRFSWKVMLVEKAGITRFIVRYEDQSEDLIYADDYLTANQRKMMSTQADMIVQYAHYLEKQLGASKKIVAVFTESRVALNGRRGRKFLPQDLNLLTIDPKEAADYVVAYDFFKPT